MELQARAGRIHLQVEGRFDGLLILRLQPGECGGQLTGDAKVKGTSTCTNNCSAPCVMPRVTKTSTEPLTTLPRNGTSRPSSRQHGRLSAKSTRDEQFFDTSPSARFLGNNPFPERTSDEVVFPGPFGFSPFRFPHLASRRRRAAHLKRNGRELIDHKDHAGRDPSATSIVQCWSPRKYATSFPGGWTGRQLASDRAHVPVEMVCQLTRPVTRIATCANATAAAPSTDHLNSDLSRPRPTPRSIVTRNLKPACNSSAHRPIRLGPGRRSALDI